MLSTLGSATEYLLDSQWYQSVVFHTPNQKKNPTAPSSSNFSSNLKTHPREVFKLEGTKKPNVVRNSHTQCILSMVTILSSSTLRYPNTIMQLTTTRCYFEFWCHWYMRLELPFEAQIALISETQIPL